MGIKKTALLLIIISALSIQSTYGQEYREGLKYRKWRVTLFPPLSTNGIHAKEYSAKYSINLIGGINGGAERYEIGGLFNYNEKFAHGFQFAGGANITGGDLAGFSISGLANISGDDMAGVQLTGGINYSKDNASGIQGAGLANIAGDDIEGMQFASLFNFAEENISGMQASGLFNYAGYSVEGLQAAGAFNIAKDDISGLQAAGVGNIAMGNIEGLLASGFINYAGDEASGLLATGGINAGKRINGLVAAGIGNFASEMNGLQVGALNVSNESNGLQVGIINLGKEFHGAPVGLISLYGNGRKNIDVRFSDAGFTELGITLGTYRVYNMLILGYNTLLDRDVYRIGLAVGLEKNIQDAFENVESKTLFVNQEFSFNHQFEDEWTWKKNRIFSYKFLVGNRFSNGLSLYAGPSLNMQVTRFSNAHDYTWYSLWSPSAKGKDYRFWVGFTVGVRVFKQKNLPLFEDFDEEWDWDW